MRVVSLKLLLRVVLIFTVKLADIANTIDATNVKDKEYCSNISGLLPLSIVAPIKYDIELDVRIQDKIILGMSGITFRVRKSTNIIHLHSHGLDVNSQHTRIMLLMRYMGEKDDREIFLYSFKELKRCDEAQILALFFYGNLTTAKYKLYLKFNYPLEEQFGIIHYTFTTNKITRLLITNTHERNATRGMFPCWDDPAVKASFNISIIHSSSTQVFSNKPVLKSTTEKYGTQRTLFHEISSISTEFLGIVIVDHLSKPQQMKINFFWHEEDFFQNKTNTLQLAKTSIADLTTTISNIMQINLTDIIEKIDHVVLRTPLKFVRKPGLIVYREQDIAFNEKSGFSGRRLKIMLLIARELVHQVFDTVNNNSYVHTSLEQMLVLFHSYYSTSQILTKLPLMDLFVVQHAQLIMDLDYDFAGNFHNITDDKEIDSITYPLYLYKGVALIRMLFHTFGPDTFRMGISIYVIDKIRELWNNQQIVHYHKHKLNYTISEIMDTWLRHGHYPEVYVDRDFGGNTAVCSLSVFNFDVKWRIPITYITGSNLKRFTLVNLQQIGYYRVNYNNRNWEEITRYLLSDDYKRIPVLNRAQLISDSFYFVSNGELESNAFFDIILYLKQETDYIAWYPMFNIIFYMSTYLKYPKGAYVKDFIVEILGTLLNNIGLENSPGEENTVTSLRLMAKHWACILGQQACMENVNDKLTIRIADLEMEIDYHKINSLWMDLVPCTLMKTLNVTQWINILNKALEEYNNNILRLLTCSENEDIIIYYLDLIMGYMGYMGYMEYITNDKRVPWKDIYYDIVKRHASKPAVLKHILDNFIIIRSKHAINDIITFAHIILNVYSTEDLDKIQKYVVKDLDPWVNYCLKCTVNRLISWQKKQMAKIIRTYGMFF
ncbi:aminopeptidase N-like isoform X2 [Odontomachus brunneus]|uniref:aminopeptidase N-like isoform X2 n=1 Tax=Odontomachus brunneus TaxID=486640 RepID=UPI0013F195DF|nr:aminopeptidase N-like isoform X2 [Odontomachus brunneus]